MTTQALYRAGVVAIAAAASVLAVADEAAAQIPSGNVIYACVHLDRDKDEGRQPRLVTVSEPCDRDETRLSWNVTGPIGLTGPQGVPGAVGAPGPVGAQGPAGAQGPQGAIGPQGGVGAQGPKGDTGATGAAGAQGPQGAIGPQGGVGPQGPKGDTGAAGAAGVQGPKGDTGATGISIAKSSTPVNSIDPTECPGGTGLAFDLIDSVGNPIPNARQVVCNGATGPQGPAGAQGAMGLPGLPGPQGPQGDTGPAGPTGPAPAFKSVTTSASAVTVSSTAVSVGSIAFTAPSAGSALVTASGLCSLSSATSITLEIATAAPASAALTGPLQNSTFVSSAPSESPAYRSIALSRPFTLSAAGTYTLFLNGWRNAGAGTALCWASLSVFFTLSQLP